MKKVYFSLLIILATCIIGITSCRKNQEAGKDPGVAALSIEELSKDAPFIKLNDAISRFDPKYLVMVYNDTRPVKEIIEKSNDLLVQLKTDPENALFQKQLTDFYHFSSVAQLKEYSLAVTESLKKLDEKYNFKKTLFVGDGGRIFYEARRMYAKAKMDAYSPDVKRKTDGLWTGFVDAYASDFGYYTAVYSEGLEPGSEMEGGGGDCTESCCWERETCKKNAKSKYYSNLWLYTTGGAASGGGAGGLSGSFVPFWGNVVGAIGGGIWGGALGAITANQIYQNDQEACNSTYKACIQKKAGN